MELLEWCSWNKEWRMGNGDAGMESNLEEEPCCLET